ncbi:MAG: 50S ribosomal protein L3 [Candidatus Omnitrophota bacterium]
MIVLLGKKIGMTQTFTEDNSMVQVTAIEAGPCPVLAIKSKSIQMGFQACPDKKLKRPQAGFFKKINVAPHKVIREFPKETNVEYKLGEELKIDLFKPGDYLDVSGISKGKGFQGGMKRWHWQGGPRTHGSTSHRRVGSIGSSTTPGRVFKGHHMPGHMGAIKATVQNLLVIKIDPEKNLLLVKGAVPGAKNSYLVISKAKKRIARVLPAAATGAAKAKAKK